MANLVVNGNFSAGITNWNSSLPTPIISATGGIGGSQCAQFTGNTQRASQNITVIVGQQYDLSFWLRFQNTGMRIRVFVRDRITNVTYLNANITSNNLGIWVNYTFSSHQPELPVFYSVSDVIWAVLERMYFWTMSVSFLSLCVI